MAPRKTKYKKAGNSTRIMSLTGLRHRRLIKFNNKNLALSYIEKNGRIPKLDAFMGMQQGALVKSKSEICGARRTKPAKRTDYKNWRYYNQISIDLPPETAMMFIERHSKFPEYYKFCVIGGTNVWIDISRAINYLTIMVPPRSKKLTKKKVAIPV